MRFQNKLMRLLGPKKKSTDEFITSDDPEFESLTNLSNLPSSTSADDPVPADVKILPYYHGFLPRKDAEDIVTKEGDFLLRRTELNYKDQKTKEWAIVLTIRIAAKGDDCVDHLIIPRNEQNTAWKVGENVILGKMELLIDLYMKGKRAIVANDNRYILKHPIQRSDWQMKHNQIIREKQVGRGAYGEVWIGYIKIDKDRLLKCAIKCLPYGMVSTLSQREELVREARVCRMMDHENIVKFRGIAIDEEPLMMLLEWCEKGSLVSLLQKEGSTMSTGEKIRFCVEAAQGLSYLEKHKLIHRDVAARNCLLDANLKVKISDFGLSQASRFYKDTNLEAKMPIRWLAPESLGQNIFTLKTDVWSFGILMNEVFTNGAQPYEGVSTVDVMNGVTRRGLRVTPPKTMPEECVKLMNLCFNENPEKRPTFLDLKSKLRKVHSAFTKKPGLIVSIFKR